MFWVYTCVILIHAIMLSVGGFDLLLEVYFALANVIAKMLKAIGKWFKETVDEYRDIKERLSAFE